MALPGAAGVLPNPMFKYSGMDSANGGDWPNTGEQRYMVEQTFPWFGTRGLQRRVAEIRHPRPTLRLCAQLLIV